MRLADRFAAALLTQQGRLMPWSPVLFGLGISLYFALSSEPALIWLWIAGGVAVFAAACAIGRDPVRAALFWAPALLIGGFALAGLRAHTVAGPVLEARYYGAIEGRVVGLDRSSSGALRIMLADVRLARIAPDKIPRRVRISLPADAIAPPAGARVMTTGHLSPPGGPAEPGGFDFQRHAWFLGLGGVGYTRVPLLLAEIPNRWNGLFGIRRAISTHVQSQIEGPAGGFAAAITTGDRSGLTPELTQALRDTNLAHLLAISGLHMGLLTGFLFGALRLGLALVPVLPWLSARKWAAVGALAGGAVYLALSGGNVATERAFIMVAVALSAVLLDRRAISLRSVAVAALIVLVLRPEAIMGPGFQMSFAATIALVIAFQTLTALGGHRGPVWSKPLVSAFLSAAVAGLATLPLAAAHFNRMANYGLLANLVAPPVMGAVVVPAGVSAALLAPFGLDWIGLWVMEQGLVWIVYVATQVASWPNPIRHIPTPPPAVLPLMALGGLGVVLLLGRVRWIGLAPMAASIVLWAGGERPDILINDTGTLVGAMTETGRALSKPRGAGFAADIWLENDGDGVDQAASAARHPADGRLWQRPIPGGLLIHASGKRALARVQHCEVGDILVASVPVAQDFPCVIYDPPRLAQTGSLAMTFSEQGRALVTAADRSGARLWNGAQATAF